MPIRTLLDNDAVLVIGIDEASGTGQVRPTGVLGAKLWQTGV
jgi:hypothetical protein